jgi:hypothetical protein
VTTGCGPIALLGSGETSQAGGWVFDFIARRFPPPVHIAILETPAGFELNSAKVAGRIGGFLEARLRNYCPKIDIIPARKRGTPYSPDEPSLLLPLVNADLIFMGPGSPTYAVRQLKGSIAWDLVRVRHRLGAALVFASAAVLAIGSYSLPVYEVFKVGNEVSAFPGLDLLSDYNLSMSFIPHWNNHDGGDEVDTSRCFVGVERFTQWYDQLPPGHTTLGVDEHTAIIFDFSTRKCSIKGSGGVTYRKSVKQEVFLDGKEFPITKLGDFQVPSNLEDDISPQVLDMVKSADRVPDSTDIPIKVMRLVNRREQARHHVDWEESDLLRLQIAELGWIVVDTPEGQKIFRAS